MGDRDRITLGLTLVLAVATGLSIANIYYNQPLLGVIAKSFGADSSGSVNFLPAATQLGYALGLVVLVPLGDAFDRRGLILWQTVGLVLSLAAAAFASSPLQLILSSIAVGVTATIAQQIIPLAAELAPPEERGRVVGTVMSGLLTGILLARTISGFVGKYFSWRVMYFLGAIVAVIIGVMLFISLPRRRPENRHSYKHLMLSLVKLVRSYPELRWAVITQGSLFASFSAFWATLALLLQSPPYYLGSDVAGLFGIIGLAGILAAPLAGRIADKRGTGGIIGLSALLVLAGFILFAVFPAIPGLSLGIVLLDVGVQMAMVSNQSVIFALEPGARNRINTIYMTGLFLFGAIGSAAGSAAWNTIGWIGVSSLGLVLAAFSFLSHHLNRRRARVKSLLKQNEL
ncbi:MFS transporter [Paenibacillus sp. GP183]|uniref:MFS transporter n=1 Tax=Paenibacillus sp. GP183 TaxID=1882751 RepID=UPI0008962FF6|nr:MFS transporter [Paenibacillus sp. GP183]SEB96039.1 Predicted arabinose efflux permease, MFS family [Paenibacillus sp. GP183]